MAEGLKDLIHQRGTIKARLTMFSKFIDMIKQIDPNQLDDIQFGELQLKLTRLQDMLPFFDEVQSKIEMCSTENIEPHIIERDNIESTFCRLISVAQNILESVKRKSDKSNNSERDNGTLHDNDEDSVLRHRALLTLT
ncbi:hypothetical protein ACJJTC_005774 [Scirpophaga incertulas]